MATIGRDALLAAFTGTEELELPSGRGTVKVRGLTRWEATEVQEGVDRDDTSAATQLLLEQRALARGVVEPQLSEEDVVQLQRNGLAADVLAIAQRISELSNMDATGGKGPRSRSRRTTS